MSKLSKTSTAFKLLALSLLIAPAFVAVPAAFADSLVGSGQFGDAAPAQESSGATTGGKDSSFFKGAASALRGNVSVIDHVKPGGMRLKRASIPLAPGAATAPSEHVANNHDLPLAGAVEDSSAKFQSLFPSLDSNGSPVAGKSLSGNAQQDKPPEAPKAHPIWQKSPFGGYYDASGAIREVIKGNQLYKYGGTMADGLTPAPSGPVEQNSMGYIKWQPIHGGPPGWY